MENEKDKLWGGKERHVFEVRCGRLKWTIGARDRTEARNALVDLMAKQAAHIHLSDLRSNITLEAPGIEYSLRLNDVIEEVADLAGPEEEAADE